MQHVEFVRSKIGEEMESFMERVNHILEESQQMDGNSVISVQLVSQVDRLTVMVVLEDE